MFELKYYAKIDAFEKAEREAAKDPQAPTPFDVNVLGPDNFLKRVTRRLSWWFFLFAFAVFRAVWPVARIGRLVIVSRYEDACKVLTDSERFPTPFGPEMHTVTDGVIFGLGLDGEPHARQRKIMENVVLPGDATRILQRTRYFTEALIDGSGGRIDALRDLCGRVFTETCSEYFALDLDEPNGFLDRSMATSTMIFADPMGTEKVRRLALNGAVRVRYLIDQAIAAAQNRLSKGKDRKDAVIDRLVAHERNFGTAVSPEEIRSIVIGIMTGMVPTTTLAAGKILEELQRRGLLARAVEHARGAEESRTKAGAANEYKRHRQALYDMLFEALRLNPALSPGMFRHAPKATILRGTQIPAGSLIMVSGLSALRDSSQFEEPGEFKPGRPWGSLPGVLPAGSPPLQGPMTLMFGGGAHGCLAAYLAMEQITEIFQILFAQDGIRFSTRAVGRLSYLGIFPRRLDMEFKPTKAPLTQHMITIQAPLEPKQFETVQGLIKALGNPARPDTPIGKAFSGTGIVHFASMSAIDAAHPEDPDAKPDYRLLLELNVDGKVEPALTRLAQDPVIGVELGKIFACVKDSNGASLEALLRRHTIDLHFLPWGPIGLNFNGTPDCPVDDIAQQKELADFTREAIDHYLHARDGVHKRAMEAINFVRKLILVDQGADYNWVALKDKTASEVEDQLWRKGASFRRFLIRPSRRRLKISDWTGGGHTVGIRRLLRSRAALFVWLLIGTTVFLQAGAIHYAARPDSWLAYGFAIVGFIGGAVLWAAAVNTEGFPRLLRWYAIALEQLAHLATSVLAVAADISFIVFLLLRWFGWPVFTIGTGAAAYCALERYLPEIELWPRLALAGVAAIVGRIVAELILYRLVPWLLKYWRTVVTALVAAAAASCLLQYFVPDAHLIWRGSTVLAAVAVTVVVRIFWPWIRRQLARFMRRLGVGGATALAIAAVLAAIVVYHDLVEAGIRQLGPLIVALGGGLMGTLVIWTAPILIFVAILAWHEWHDKIDERTAALEKIRDIAATENPPNYAHNHITAVTPLKPGPFRKLTLALAMFGIGKAVDYWFRPGFVLNMGTIHYARWFRLPESEVFIFFSNYDGSWQSYLEDFVTKAHWGQSAAWSNGWGFPRTKLLAWDGAEDGDRFKRWVRRQQIATQFWFSRFPELTTDQIRSNALIHYGLMHAKTDTAARAWLDYFGTQPRPDNTIESDEVQSLVFRGLPRHKYTICAPITLPDDAGACKAWLDLLEKNVAFGELPDVADKTATFVAFSARGLQKCLEIAPEKADAAMSTFPPAFRLGMGNRFRILGDGNDVEEVKKWRWADIDTNTHKAVDAMLFIYGKEEAKCHATFADHCRALKMKPEDVRFVLTQPVKSRMVARKVPDEENIKAAFEHFGYRDGISQPIIRGSLKQDPEVEETHQDVVEAGELILGYKDSSMHVAPAMTLPAERDAKDDLETDTPGFPSRFPRFGESRNADLRDFGRNGTFVAVRQLAQDVTGFDQFLTRQKNELNRFPGIQDIVGGEVTEEWVAAKVMGRWRTGASLVTWPNVVKGEKTPDIQDNDFRFGRDDPQGLRCPLGAHIRRANPRGSLDPGDAGQLVIEKRHRLLRRGRSYESGDEKGLMFVGLCADLERQFEFLQQTWIGSPNFHGLTKEPDPITAPPGCPVHGFTVPTPSGPVVMQGLSSFVSVKAGGYFFMPSRSAIRFLARAK